MTPQAPDYTASAPSEKKPPSKPWIIRGGLLLAGILVLFFCGLLLFQTNWVQQKVQAKINAAVPGAVIWEQCSISLLKRSLELRHGRLLDPERQTVVTFDRLVVRFNLFALLRKTVDIAALVLENPHIDLTINPTGLNINRVFLTQPAEAVDQGDKTASPFKWILRSIHLHKGRLEFNDPAGQLKVKATSIELTGGVSFPGQNGAADLTIGSIEIQSPRFSHRFAPLELSTQLENGRMAPLSINIHTNRSHLNLNGSIDRLFAEPHLDLTAGAELNLAELKPFLPMDADLDGHLTARLKAQGVWTDPRITITLTSDGGTLFARDIEDVLIDLTMVNRMVTINEARFSMPDGAAQLAGNIDLSPLFPQSILHYEGNLAEVAYDLTLEGDDLTLAPLSPPDMDIHGIADGRLKINGRGFDPRYGTADVVLSLNARQLKAPWLEQPLDAQVTLTGHLEDGAAAWSGLHAHTEAFDLTSQGRLHLDSQRVDGTLAIKLPELSRALAPLGMDTYQGDLALDAALSGFVRAPEIELELTGRGLQAEPYRLGDLFITGRYADDHFTVKELRLINNTSEINLEGAIRLTDRQTEAWASNAALSLTIQRASLELQDFFSDMQGHLHLDGDIAGTVRNPTGQMQIKGQAIDLGRQAIDSIDGTVHLENGKVTVDRSTITLPRSAPITVKGWYQFDGASYSVELTAKGVDLGAIAAVKDQSLVQGRLGLQLSGEGSVANPQLNGSIQLRRLHINGNPSKDVDLALAVQDGTARIDGDLGFTLTGAYTLAPGEFNLAIEFQDTDLAPYFTLFNRNRFGGLLTGSIIAQGNIARMAEMTGKVGLSDVRLTYDGQSIVKTGQVNLAMEKGEATLSQTTLHLLNNGHLNMEGMMSQDKTLRVQAQGALPARTLQILWPEPLNLSGNMGLNAELSGSLTNPKYIFDVTFDDIGGQIPHFDQELKNLSGNVRFDASHMAVKDLRGGIENGTFELSGDLQWVNFEPRQIDLQFRAQQLPIHIPEMLQARINGSLHFNGQPDSSRLSGIMVIHDGFYYKDLELQPFSISNTAPRPEKKETPKYQGIMGWQNIQLDVKLERGGLFRIENNLSEMDIDFTLHFRGQPDRPLINGRAEVISGEIHFPILSAGTLIQTQLIPASTQTFIIQRGVIDFINPSRIEPNLDIRGQVNVRHWTVYLDISGTPDDLEFGLSSVPSETEADIISLLLTGGTSSEIARLGDSSGMSGQQRLMEFTTSTFQHEIKALTGLDLIETESSPGDSENDEASVTVTVGKKLSERLTLKYATESRGADIINSVIAEYRILDNIRAQGFQNTTGNFGGSLNFRHEFR